VSQRVGCDGFGDPGAAGDLADDPPGAVPVQPPTVCGQEHWPACPFPDGYAAQLREAFAGPGVLESVYEAPFGTGPGAVLAHVRIVEVLVHGWDLARATGQSAGFPDDVAGRALARSRQRLTTRPKGPGVPFAAEVPVPQGAPAVDRLAGGFSDPAVSEE